MSVKRQTCKNGQSFLAIKTNEMDASALPSSEYVSSDSPRHQVGPYVGWDEASKSRCLIDLLQGFIARVLALDECRE